jgi:RHS repeat-associated protein
MTTRTIGGTTYNYTYGDTNHVDAPTKYNGNSYKYDAVGTQITGTVKSVTQSRLVDAENRISSVVTGTTTLSFVYDGDGKRLIQSVTQGSSTERTLYVGNLYEETLSKPGHPYIVYYYLGAKMVGERKGNYSSGNGQFRIVGDHLGSTTLTVDTASPPAVVYRAYYKPYGEIAFQSGTSITSVGYTGQRLDGGSGSMYYGARYYDPVLSMFVSADPTTPDTKQPMDYDKQLYARIQQIPTAQAVES